MLLWNAYTVELPLVDTPSTVDPYILLSTNPNLILKFKPTFNDIDVL